MDRAFEDWTPTQIVAELDRWIVGQRNAKRAVAVAMRNRWRRRQLPSEVQADIYPKNLILIGPTGVGKTEIARRMAQLQRAPFLKVEASKYSQVGYHGRDVETMVRDLLDVAIDIVRTEKVREVEKLAAEAAERKLAEMLWLQRRRREGATGLEAFTPLAGSGILAPHVEGAEGTESVEDVLERLRAGEFEDEIVSMHVKETRSRGMEMFSGSGTEYVDFDPSFLAKLRGMPEPRREVRAPVREARKLLAGEEADGLFDKDAMVREAIERTEQTGILFIDEIDKIAGRSQDGSPDVSREGVQRDLLPLVEGCSVTTRYGNVRTDHILFVSAGAFHITSPDDLIPELQGRFPVRVQLDSLGREELLRILKEPRNSLVRQYGELLAVDGVTLDFRPDGLEEIATLADRANIVLGDIGARRLHTVMERLLEEVAFEAPDHRQGTVTIDRPFLKTALASFYRQLDVSKI